MDDYFFGTGATRPEKALAWAGGLLLLPFLVYAVAAQQVAWNVGQIIVAVLLALDLGGGMVANALNSCKRFYHAAPASPPNLLKNPLFFTMLHIHPLLVWGLFAPALFYGGVVWYALLVLFAVTLLKMPDYLQRPTSMLFILLGIMLNLYVIPSPLMFEWFIPVLFIKILGGRLLA
jgi:hypothetical protein